MKGYVPNVVEAEGRMERSWDLLSRLLKDRIVFVTGEIEDNMASVIIAELLYLDSEGEEDITLYVNSPGGSVPAGLAIIDTMHLLNCDVSTVAMGCCASMGVMILSQGTKGKRFILPHGEVMIHQPLGGIKGQATDIQITAEHIIDTKNMLAEMIAEATGQDKEKVLRDMERDYWLKANKALEYGIVDEIFTKKWKRG